MTIEQMKERRAKLVTDAQALIPKNGVAMTKAAHTEFNNIMAEAETLRAKYEGEERSTRPPRSQPGAGETNSAEKRAFERYMKFGETTGLREQRDLSTGTGSAGGYIIAQDFLPQLIEAKKAWGQLATAVGQKVTRNGEPLRISGVDDTSNASSIIGESVTGTPVTVTETDPTFAGAINNVSFLSTGIVKISLAELQDAYFDLDAFIREQFGKRIARGLAGLIVSGSQDTNFASIIASGQPHVTSQHATTLTYADFVAMYAAIDPAYLQTASWVMNSTTRAAILGLTDTLGRPLFVPSVNTDTLDRILGLPVVISQSHPNLTANTVGAVQLGSLKDAYTLRTAGDVSILRLNERFADNGQVGFIGYHRNSGWLSPVGNPIVNLKQAAS